MTRKSFYEKIKEMEHKRTYFSFRYIKGQLTPAGKKRKLDIIKLIIKSRAVQGHCCASFHKSHYEESLLEFTKANPEFFFEEINQFTCRVSWARYEGDKLKTNQILKDIDENGGFCNINKWNRKEIAEWVKASYDCSTYVANNVARNLSK